MPWTSQRLNETLMSLRAHHGDTTTIEVKRAASGLPHMAETLCAFANMPTGGTVILGVTEGDGEFRVTGVRDAADLEAGLASMARTAVSPSPQLDFSVVRVEDKDVLVAEVHGLRLADRPATVRGQAFLRRADGDYVMQEHELRMLAVSQLHADERVNEDLAPALGRSQADLDKGLVNAYVAAVRMHDRRLRDRNADRILRMTSVLTSSGEPTLAGLYALGDYPQGQYPALAVTAAVQLPGDEGQAQSRNLATFTGPLPVLLEETLARVSDDLDAVQRYREDGHMEVAPELPLNAVRELIAHALVHRDLEPQTLGTGKRIQIRLTADRLFIQSPGGLQGISLAQLESKEHAQAAVNQRLYRIATRLRTQDGAAVIEGEGGGIREVFQSVAGRGLPRPLLVDTGVQFTATLWRPDGRLAGRRANPAAAEPPRTNQPAPAPTPAPPAASDSAL